VIALLRRWGLKTLGDLAGLPSRPLSERLGQRGVMWQRLARGEDLQPLIAGAPDAPIEETLDLEWPVEGLEPLSFVLARMCEPLADRLAARDLAAVVLRLSCRLVSRETETRELQLPAPMRDPKVLRTLILLHLESHPLPGGVDRLTLGVEAAPARITQFSLLARARPVPEQMATLLARLSALLGERRVGAPALVDSHRPGAFAMTRFSGGLEHAGGRPAEDGEASSDPPRAVVRRFRVPVPARVIAKNGRPVRVSMERRDLEGGVVTAAAGPWRTSGEWWKVTEGTCPERAARVEGTCPERAARVEGWSRDEWDVALSDGALYRIYRDRTTDRWFVDGIVD
jgi:protein ImuB